MISSHVKISWLKTFLRATTEYMATFWSLLSEVARRLDSPAYWELKERGIEDITRWREDINFMFECHENIKFISSRHCVVVSEDVPKLVRRQDERFRTFSNVVYQIFQRLPKIEEDYRRRPKKIRRCFDHTLINNYSLKSRWIVAEYLPSLEAAR